jgi:maltooligosyltrehalose trehalohydrolase
MPDAMVSSDGNGGIEFNIDRDSCSGTIWQSSGQITRFLPRKDALINDLQLIGLHCTEDRCELTVWAPHCQHVDILLPDRGQDRIAMEPFVHRHAAGYFRAEIDRSLLGHDYWLVLDNQQWRADPASRYQPHGVHGPSRFMDSRFAWQANDWAGLPLADHVIYELHTGTFSTDGTFAGAELRLDELVRLGITAVELMPVAQFPGSRNWGYDGVFPFAAQSTYGGPDGLRRLVDACHQRGLAVILDVVYNHLGPEGNYLRQFGPYFTSRYHTPWGDALNYDEHDSDGVRRFFIDNALYWIRECRIDGLRLDAIQTIFDNSAYPFLTHLADEVHHEAARLGRPVHLWGETNQNDARQLVPRSAHGIGLDGVWNDDFHHALHAKLTGERMSVYSDHGPLNNLARAYRDGFVLDGRYSHHRRRHHGSDSSTIPPERFVVFSQNHDQIGNRLYGDRLRHLVPWQALYLIAGVTIVSPNVPMLFMGEEYGEDATFAYFVDHQDAGLRRAVKRGRLRDCEPFRIAGRPVPDPTAEATFAASRLTEEADRSDAQQSLWRFYQQLLKLRRDHPALRSLNKSRLRVEVDEASEVMICQRRHPEGNACLLAYFGHEVRSWSGWWPTGVWQRILDSADDRWDGPRSRLPEQLTVPEERIERLELQPYQFVLWTTDDHSASDCR